MKKFISMLLCCCMMMPLFAVSVHADYPLIMPKDYKLYVQKGNVANLRFTIFTEFKNEGYCINVYKGTKVSKENLVASASDTMYNTSSIRDLTITWDTDGYDKGIYTVEYYMSFYSLYDWHEAPNRYSNMTVEIFEQGQIANKVLNTDIKAFIDGHPIRSFNIDGYTSIVVEDLDKYGFSVAYDNEERTLKIEDKDGEITSTYTHVENAEPVGSKAMDVYYTDIRTYIKSSTSSAEFSANGYNANGLTLIRIDELDEYGKVVWDQDTRTISFTRN